MLHRLALRVLPQLQAAVTAPDVRRRKRWVMVAPGLVVFLLYRILTHARPLSDPWLLLAMSGMLATPTAYWAYAMGRRASPARIVRTDGVRRLLWVGGWIGCVYGVQLSLLVLALLALFVDYNFLLHPEGPAMMALIIACTAVTRDAFEIGHVVRLEAQGGRMVTFPDGGVWRGLPGRDARRLVGWAGAGLAAGGAVAAASGLGGDGAGGEAGLAAAVCVVAACGAHGAFLSGRYPHVLAADRLKARPWWEVFRFWMWPCLAFALTYYATQMGVVLFVLQWERVPFGAHLLVGGMTGAMTAGYGYALGARVHVEARTRGIVPETLKRCPFVMELFAKMGQRASG